MKNKDLALRVAGAIFSLGALMHLLRLLRRIPLVVNGVDMPLTSSVIGLFITAGLAFWMLSASAGNDETQDGDEQDQA